MADESDIAGAGYGVRERCVQSADWVHYAQAVWPDEAHLALNDLRNLALKFFAMLAKLLEAGRDDDATRNAAFHRLVDEIGDGIGWRGDHYQVNFFGQFRNAGISLDSQHIGALRVHRIYGSSKRAAQQVPQNRPADAARTLGGADDGNAFGKKQGIKGMAF